MTAILEICVDTIAGLQAATAGGADRIELCSALALGGLTPSYGLMQSGQGMAMIRPRAGDFMWSPAEVAAMLAEIDLARRLGLTGVVIGAMTATGHLDVPVLRDLICAARGLKITLHRVVDLLDDPTAAVPIAVDLGIHHILSSGGAARALDGISVLGRMVAAAEGRLSVMAGAGLHPDHIAPLAAVGIRAFHASARRKVQADARLTRLGFAPADSYETDAGLVAAFKAAVRAI